MQQIKFQQRKKDIEIDETRREIQSLQVIFNFHLPDTFENQLNNLIVIFISVTINLLFRSLFPHYLLFALGQGKHYPHSTGFPNGNILFTCFIIFLLY